MKTVKILCEARITTASLSTHALLLAQGLRILLVQLRVSVQFQHHSTLTELAHLLRTQRRLQLLMLPCYGWLRSASHDEQPQLLHAPSCPHLIVSVQSVQSKLSTLSREHSMHDSQIVGKPMLASSRLFCTLQASQSHEVSQNMCHQQIPTT